MREVFLPLTDYLALLDVSMFAFFYVRDILLILHFKLEISKVFIFISFLSVNNIFLDYIVLTVFD